MTGTEPAGPMPLARKRVRHLVDVCHNHGRSVTDTGRCLRGHPWPCTEREAALVELRDAGQLAALFGFYPVVERTVTIKNSPVAIYDVLGKDVPLFHYAVTDDDEALGTQFVHASRAWFDSLWNSVAREYEP